MTSKMVERIAHLHIEIYVPVRAEAKEQSYGLSVYDKIVTVKLRCLSGRVSWTGGNF